LPTYTKPGAIADVVGTTGRIEATWGNAIRDRVVNLFATTTDRDSFYTSPWDGAECYVTATHTHYIYTGAVWRAWDSAFRTYSPAWLQSATGVTYSGGIMNYTLSGVWCDVTVQLTATNNPGAGGVYTRVSMPVAPNLAANLPVGQGFLFDTSAGLSYPFIVRIDDSTYFAFFDTTIASLVKVGDTGSTFSTAIASGDIITFNARYEIA
jgi:hypothetical protein